MRVLSYRQQPAELSRACRMGSLQALKPFRPLLGSQMCSTAFVGIGMAVSHP